MPQTGYRETAYTSLVGCSVPIQQAPMGTVSTPDLAVAVAESGGVGTVTVFGLSPGQVASLLDRMAERTGGVLSANFLTEAVDPDAVSAAAERSRIVDFFWSWPRPALVEVAHGAGALVTWQVGSLDEARAAVDAGADVVAVQGIDAGGHVRGRTALLPLLVEVLDVVDVPVLAAGGIGSPRALAAVLAAGAAGARVGTAFIATTESGAHPAYKDAVVAAAEGSTEITDSFAVCPLCATSPTARTLSSAVAAVRATDPGAVLGQATVAGSPVAVPRGFGMPPSTQTSGRIEAMAMYAGQGVGQVRGIVPAGQLITYLCAGIRSGVPAQAGAGSAPRLSS